MSSAKGEIAEKTSGVREGEAKLAAREVVAGAGVVGWGIGGASPRKWESRGKRYCEEHQPVGGRPEFGYPALPPVLGEL